MNRRPVRGSIPACAGKPPCQCFPIRMLWVHPRVRGEAASWMVEATAGMGPSPRARGSRRQHDLNLVSVGSIPACAGKPSWTTTQTDRSWVHPRVRGEARRPAALSTFAWGPSPRARGSPRKPHPPSAASGSIPACAGKPRRHRREVPLVGVHPRVRGEAGTASWSTTPSEGPSPRARGSHRRSIGSRAPMRSIPACAGKPLKHRE